MNDRASVYVPDADYVVHICRHQHLNIPLSDRTEDGEPCALCPQCGARFVHRSSEALAVMRQRAILRDRILKTFPF
ncbi:MAG: hypothetical protein EXS64_04360 [Candidatus Latescibacteria bacterium]|nr:hypothetical protein [Candidatus Latescibacterota bacterium]